MIRASVDDAERINEWIWRDSGKRHPFLEEILSDRMNVVLIEGEGGAFFVWRGPGIYETHCFFDQRGKQVRETSKRFLKHMHDHYGAGIVWAAIPDESRHVKVFVRWLGFKSVGHEALSQGPCELFLLEM